MKADIRGDRGGVRGGTGELARDELECARRDTVGGLPVGPPREGLRLADLAIGHLKQIRADDQERDLAGERVVLWVMVNFSGVGPVEGCGS